MTDALKDRLAQLQRLHGWMTVEKGERMAELVLSSGPKLVVELGVFGGRTIGAMAMAGQSAGNGCRFIGIDPWTKAAALEGTLPQEHVDWWSKIDLNKIFIECGLGLRQLGLDEVELWRMTDEEALPKFEDGSIDILHIDATHTEEVSMRLVNQWLPKVKAGGHCAFDDLDWPTQAKAIAVMRERCDVLFEDGKYMVARKR
jgi:predicted O-methyltransferase YrrM